MNRMLIIDDSKAMRSFLGVISRDCGFETEEASNGQEALDVISCSGPFDIALVDWDMPVMNGFDFVKAVRGNPAFQNMKMMMVTTQTSMEAITDALKEGADDFLMKPLTQEMLQDKLRLLGFEC